MLYLGLDNGLYISRDDGQTWFQLKNNLPPAPIYWVAIQEHFDDLVVGTYGRGYYILDDIGPLRQMPADLNAEKLFSIRDAYRFNSRESIKTDGPSYNSGRNPNYGVPINYFIAEGDSINVTIAIENAEGEIIRTLEGSDNKGVNRIWWDLRYEPTYKPKLRTVPPGRPWVQLNGEGWRPLVTWDLDLWRGQFGPRVVPGQYTAVLNVNDKEFRSSFSVLKDPNSQGTVADIEKQVELSLELRDAMNVAVNMINKIEMIRSELVSIKPSLHKRTDLKEAERLEKLALNISAQLYDVHLTGAREDAFRSPMKLYGRLSAVASDLNASGIDFAPTDQQGEVYEVLNQRLQQAKDEFDQMIEEDIVRFNEKLNNMDVQIGLEKTEKTN